MKEGMQGRLHESERKQGRDGIIGSLPRLCALLRIVKLLRGLKKRYFKGVLTWMHRNNGQGLLKAKVSPLLKKLYT